MSRAATTTVTIGPILDKERCLAVNIGCTGCGYNLRSQPLDGRCPECGRAVAGAQRSKVVEAGGARDDMIWIGLLKPESKKPRVI